MATTRQTRDLLQILEDHEHGLRKMRQTLARIGNVTDHTNVPEPLIVLDQDPTNSYGADFSLGRNDTGAHWLYSHRMDSATGEVGDLVIYDSPDSDGPWDEWLRFDVSDDAFKVSKALSMGLAGTASAPAIQRSTDSDTGIYFPAANQVAITVAGRQALLFSGMETSADGGQIEFGPGSGHSTAMYMDRNQDAFRWVIGGVSKLELTGSVLYLAGVNDMYWGANDWINFNDATNAWSFYEDSTLVAQIFRPGSGYGGINVWFNGVGVRALRVGGTGTGPGGTGRAVYTDN